ncbi:hypothetical protein D3I60_00050 [Brevibacterium permense]|uniref:hypothetical protein n=1 Tax=Brevibacterium permense TaxID=234834 RepID=UPI0021CF6342|nr:hypothetical protein [Brevibacterium permense]MCU4295488.1 hypothetical protein [Brevibacterium permense]
MSDQPRFTNTHAQCRAKAIEVAAEVVGLPEDYQQKYSQSGKPIKGAGFLGALGATTLDGGAEMTANTYPDALIAVASYIATGRIEADQ